MQAQGTLLIEITIKTETNNDKERNIMKKDLTQIEAARITDHIVFGSKTGDRNGAFIVAEADGNNQRTGTTLSITVNDGSKSGWETAAVEASTLQKVPGQKRDGPQEQVLSQPTFDQVRCVKDFFWEEDETVQIFIPANAPRDESHTIWLYRKVGQDAELPMSEQYAPCEPVTDFKVVEAEEVEDELASPDGPSSDGEPI